MPQPIREAIRQHEQFQGENAVWLGQVALAVGEAKDNGPERDITASRKRAKEEARAKGGRGKRRKATLAVSQSLVALWGHRLVRQGPKWQCHLCKVSWMHWVVIATGQCIDSVAKKWVGKRRSSYTLVSVGRGRRVLLFVNFLWCSLCGAVSGGSVKALVKPGGRARTCLVHRERGFARRALLQQLRKLQSGINPNLRTPPFAADQRRSRGIPSDWLGGA